MNWAFFLILATFLIRIFAIRLNDFPDLYNSFRIEDNLFFWPFGGLTTKFGEYECNYSSSFISSLLFGGEDIGGNILNYIVPRLLLFIPLLCCFFICIWIKRSLLAKITRNASSLTKRVLNINELSQNIKAYRKHLKYNILYTFLLPSTSYFLCAPGRESISYVISIIAGYFYYAYFLLLPISEQVGSLNYRRLGKICSTALLCCFIILMFIPITSDNQYILIFVLAFASLFFLICFQKPIRLGSLSLDSLSLSFLRNDKVRFRFTKSNIYTVAIFSLALILLSIFGYYLRSSLVDLSFVGGSFRAYTDEYSYVIDKYPLFFRFGYLLQSSLLLTLCSISLGAIPFLGYCALIIKGFMQPLLIQNSLLLKYRIFIFIVVTLLIGFMPGYAYYKYWLFITPLLVSSLQASPKFSNIFFILCWLLLLARSISNVFSIV